MSHRFFNTNVDSKKELDKSSEYSNQIHVTPSKARDEYIDRSNPVVKVLFIVLGLFCVVGVIYYMIEWFHSK